MWEEWMNRASSELPGCDDALFKEVWNNNRFIFDGKSNAYDGFDYHSARLVAATIKGNNQLLVCLPDFKRHRPAFLLATGLIRYFLDSRQNNTKQSGHVLYFGANIGIREQLRSITINGLDQSFAKVFSQQDIRRGAIDINAGEEDINTLPKVITIYSPADPVEILRTASPPWIAIDCSDANYLSWLYPLLNEAVKSGIPVVAWCQNPLSGCVADFEKVGNTFIWPSNSHPTKERNLYTLLSSYTNININPAIIYGTSANQFSTLLCDIKYLLVNMTMNEGYAGRIERDAIKVHWRYFNALESLAVPFNFFEAEATKYWGMQPMMSLASVCNHFRNVIRSSKKGSIITKLDNVGTLLEKAQSSVENLSCALWEACLNYCLEDSRNEENRLLIFSSENHKKMFLFALLARYNTTEDDLIQLQINVTSLNELPRKIESIAHEDIITVVHPTIVGLPSGYKTPLLFYTFTYPELDFILYPHQYSSFLHRKAEWSRRIGGNFHRNITTLSRMSPLTDIPEAIPGDERIQVMDPIEINIETAKRTKDLNGYMWQPEDITVEVENLFKFDIADEEEIVLNDQLDNVSSDDQYENLMCEEAVKIIFDQGWYAYFEQNDIINVICENGLDLRYVRSLRPGERVLIIHGQRRQSLYDLIISRVHRHPSIELHIALIRRWQEDLRIAYSQWCKQQVSQNEFNEYGPRDIEGLLRRMKGRGSKRSTYQTFTNWITGNVICPREPEDLRRIAEILNLIFVRQNYETIFKAANRLRGLHRGLSNRLNHWIQDQLTGIRQKGEDDIIDADLGLTFGDVRNSLLVLQIIKIESLDGPFLRSTIGRIEREANYE